MFKYSKPIENGISAKHITEFISVLEQNEIATHDIILARGNNIFFEQYWEPFHADRLHRMYSVTKSVVSIAIGFLIDEGKLSLDDKIVDHFPEFVPEGLIEGVQKQTIRNMLMMSTGFIPQRQNWFKRRPEDRVKCYFDSHTYPLLEKEVARVPGEKFDYDSPGSFVLGALVEKLSGMPLLDYLRVKAFDKIGVSKEAKILKCPGGYSWGDSGLLCKASDLLKIAKFVMNLGNVDGEQLISREYLEAATSNLIDTNYGTEKNSHEKQGYGYLIWQCWKGFSFLGMGCQFAICVPEKDIIMIYNSDNQGNRIATDIIVDNFFKHIVNNIDAESICDDSQNEKELESVCSGLELFFGKGEKTSPIADKICGKTFILEQNNMGISSISLHFSGDEGVLNYTNAQGDKELRFGFGKNIFEKFPEEGYSREIGSVRADGNYYDCAASAAWTEQNRLDIWVQIIDEYLGRLKMSFTFENESVSIRMLKTAEDFLDEYSGDANGKME